MPPEVSPCHPTPIVTPIIQFLPPEPPRSLLANQPPKYNYYRGTKRMMMITKKKLIPILIFTLSGFSILRLLKISTVSLFSSPPAVALPPTHPHTQGPSKSQSMSSDSAATLTEKEFRLLLNLVSLRAPCNLLIFGLEQQYLNLSSINAGGKTVFLEDNPEKLNKIEANYSNTRIYKVEYQTVAKDAYKLLKYARQNPACGLQHLRSGSLKNSSCPLSLTRLPREVYKRKWDMVVVDGPRGDTPDAPGRMATIYTASLIARSGNITDVVVHDVDRMIEKWFAWEFLCDENLVSSKGKLWNFRIISKSNSSTFCPACNDCFVCTSRTACFLRSNTSKHSVAALSYRQICHQRYPEPSGSISLSPILAMMYSKDSANNFICRRLKQQKDVMGKKEKGPRDLTVILLIYVQQRFIMTNIRLDKNEALVRLVIMV